MKDLDLDSINKTAPYKVFRTERYHYYKKPTKSKTTVVHFSPLF